MTAFEFASEGQIRELRSAAQAAGDTRMTDICDVALAAHETANAEGAALVDPDGYPMTRTEARELCTAVISEGAE